MPWRAGAAPAHAPGRGPPPAIKLQHAMPHNNAAVGEHAQRADRAHLLPSESQHATPRNSAVVGKHAHQGRAQTLLSNHIIVLLEPHCAASNVCPSERHAEHCCCGWQPMLLLKQVAGPGNTLSCCDNKCRWSVMGQFPNLQFARVHPAAHIPCWEGTGSSTAPVALRQLFPQGIAPCVSAVAPEGGSCILAPHWS